MAVRYVDDNEPGFGDDDLSNFFDAVGDVASNFDPARFIDDFIVNPLLDGFDDSGFDEFIATGFGMGAPSSVTYLDDPTRANFQRGPRGGTAAAAGRRFRAQDRTQEGVAQQVRADAVRSAVDAINAQYRAAVAGSGGASASHRQAIAEALELLQDVQGNRAALNEQYDKFLDTTDPYEQAAIEAAGGVVEAAQPALDEIAEERTEGIRIDFDEAEAIVSDVADLIGAGDNAKQAAQERITGEDMALDHASQEAAEIMAMVEMEEAVLKETAEAEDIGSEAQARRRQELTDAQFKQMEEDAANRLARARAAARAAAAAAARRRAAARAQRDAAIAAARDELGGLDPIEAGQFGAIAYLNEHGGGIPADRAQFIQGRTMEAIENFMPADPSAIFNVFNEAGQNINRDEADLIAGAIDAFRDTRDREQHFVNIGGQATSSREALEAGGAF